MEALEVLLLLFLNYKLTVIAVTVSFLFFLSMNARKRNLLSSFPYYKYTDFIYIYKI